MAEKVNVPKIRFAGFDEEWEQHELSHYLDVSTEKNLTNSLTKQDVLSVSGDFGIVNQIEFQGRSFAGVSVENYGVVHTGDVVYTKSPLSSNPFGIIKTNKGKTGIVSTLYAVYSPNENTFPDFVQDYFEQDSRLNNYLHPLVNKGAKNDMKVSAENALKGLVYFPEYEEQRKISKFFSVLNHLIALHRRKYDKLVTVKKSMLDKMFPKDGQMAPEIRFAGFTGDWVRKELWEIGDVYSGRDYKHLSTGNIPVYGTGGYMLSVDKALSYDKDAIGLGRKGTIDKPYILNAPFWTVDTLFYVVPKININLEFVSCWFLLIDWKSKDESTGVPSLSKQAINIVEVMVPNIEEQTAIGNYFRNLDNLITAQQKKLDKLKTIKKSMLDKLFV